ncbi:hypothetical protein [Borrelia persica]|uniref:hypothetical protein n=1 Tax=Borrelia persica TaxID=44448 RepID=UPI00046538B2|nr:hypothetical protein [Borrelia persica]
MRYEKFLSVSFVLAFLGCGLKDLITTKKGKESGVSDSSIQQNYDKVNDISIKLNLNIQEKETLKFFIEILKDEYSKATSSTNASFKRKVNDIDKIEQYVEQFLLEFNDNSKAQELLSIIKDAKENPGIAGGIDMVKSGIAGAFDNFFSVPVMTPNDKIHLPASASAESVFESIKIACEAYKAK